jgi:hypothetical protein
MLPASSIRVRRLMHHPVMKSTNQQMPLQPHAHLHQEASFRMWLDVAVDCGLRCWGLEVAGRKSHIRIRCSSIVVPPHPNL